jgi:hypothetical protein
MRGKHVFAVLVFFAAVSMLAADASAVYHPTVGRFMQRDPGPAGPVAPRIGQYRDGMNQHQYVRSNPTISRDPYGLSSQQGTAFLMPTAMKASPWQSGKPLERRCPEGSEDLCDKLTFSFYHSDPENKASPGYDRGFLSHAKGAGTYIGVTDVGHLIYNLDQQVRYCQCVETLTIVAHGCGPGSGGFSMGGADQYVGGLLRPDKSKQYDNVRAFGRQISGVMCKRCFINLMACDSATGDTAAILASETKCAVTGTVGHWGGYPKGDWAGMWEIFPGMDADKNVYPPDLSTYYPDGHSVSGGPTEGDGVFEPVHPPPPATAAQSYRPRGPYPMP